MLVPIHGLDESERPAGGRAMKETRMSYAQSLLAKDEQILYEGRQHWLAPASDGLKPIVLILIGLLLFTLSIMFSPPDIILNVQRIVAAVFLLVGLVWFGVIYASWRAQEYIITTRRVLKVEGLFDKKSGDSSLDKINDAVLKQGIWARIFHYGSLDILTANEEAIDRYEMLANVVEFKKAMLNAKNQLEDGYRGRVATPQTAPATAGAAKGGNSDDATATLSKLAELRDKGAITPAEYEAKKAELLGRI
jgi:uncharacterized membrane protein YdbT with pleckstrin-like domain